jgi:glutathione S-transferase
MKKISSSSPNPGAKLTLISHHLCPYVQRAAIALAEKGLPFERIYVDLARKPEWFKNISPLGKTPVLLVGDRAIFESAVILEYLEESFPHRLHPEDALERADHRGLIEYASSILSDIWGFYSATDPDGFDTNRERLRSRFVWLEDRIVAEPWFAGQRFTLVDAVYGSVFRYFDVFDQIEDFGILAGKPKLARWRASLSERASIRNAVTGDYNARLWRFLKSRDSVLSRIIAEREIAAGAPQVHDRSAPAFA